MLRTEVERTNMYVFISGLIGDVLSGQNCAFVIVVIYRFRRHHELTRFAPPIRSVYRTAVTPRGRNAIAGGD